MDSHGLLGLPPDAGEREVKHAFRRLAMRWHPDRNPDPAALEHFKRLRAAYEAILARLAAADDDRSGDEGDEGDEGDGDAAHPADDSAAGATRGSAGGSTGKSTDAGRDEGTYGRGRDRHQELTLSVEEAFLGGERTVEVEDTAVCECCDGSGVEQLTHTRLCAACHGSGRLRSRNGLASCGNCGGRGYLSKQSCGACEGTGRRRAQRRVSVTIPAGVVAGDELRVAGAGDAAPSERGVAGDLILTIVLAPHSLYRLDGRDLLLDRPVSVFRMLLGGELPVPLPGSIRNVKLAPGSATPRELRVRGAGLPGRDGTTAGALIIRLVPVMPDAAPPRLRALLEEIENALGVDRDAAMPDLANWEARWLADD
ncbi:MAG: DnaJ C-terminal domain-containing protein [Aromatoleum sp.]|jgi:molecular chaperone DnaJ|uniref:DnaJ C-terminal domain-containing protein n=1 Tax=Aromatoleum sp. TaxID=2307007 RepID=UPI0028957731|nr:DnaJ C-terminal domain-containing protein [Aromatoleum sp.]MDT3670081.1 DnaJ C-terminal domain-containing protein [Aromatoleum sp.]